LKTHHAFALALAAASTIPAHAETPFLCGEFGPGNTLGTSADLGITATSMIASPGNGSLPSNFTQPGWFLVDVYGAGPVMGCQPTTSTIQGWAQKNSYFPDGTLKDIIATRFQSPPTKLSFTYQPGLPYRLQMAENFCMSVGGQKVRYTFAYKNGRLVTMQQALDSTCPSPAPVSVTFEYGDKNVPGLPTLVTVLAKGSAPQVSSYAYTVSGGLITSVKVSSPGSPSYVVQPSYTGGRITALDLAGTHYDITYRNGAQWKSMIDGSHDWGLTISYENNLVSQTLQNTGCGGQCPPNTFGY
jgi:hypothetical protein